MRIWLVAFMLIACTPVGALAVDPVGDLTEVKYISTVDGDTILILDSSGQLQRVNLLSINDGTNDRTCWASRNDAPRP